MIGERLYGARGRAILAVFAAFVFIVMPVLNLTVSPENPLHVSAYWVTLLGKIMCYAIDRKSVV